MAISSCGQVDGTQVDMDGHRNFSHPYQPYDIQLQLMDQIYRALAENKKIGIFESPTGTGKTLSLICAAMTWLRENKSELIGASQATGNTSDTDSDDEPEWVKEAYQSQILNERAQLLVEYEQYLDTINPAAKVANSIDEKFTTAKRRKKTAHLDVNIEGVAMQENEFLLEPYESDSDIINSSKDDKRKKLDNEIKTLLNKLEGPDEFDPVKNMEIRSPVKIFFSSRTHSQLNQFASQLRLPKFPASFKSMDNERIKYLPLGSRKQLCVHPKVSKLGGNFINDACLDAVNKKECEFYTNSKDLRIEKNFRDHTFKTIHDIEDLTSIGKTLDTCPYYSSRAAISGSEIVTLPYQHLLLENARSSLGIDLKDSIVIVDEAHNLIETINSIHSAHISLSELKPCKIALQLYLNKFRTRLNSGNRVNLMKLIKILDVLIQFITKEYKNGKEINSSEIFDKTNADIVNIHKLERYMKLSKIAFKIDRYIQSISNLPENEKSGQAGQPLLFKVASFLKTLTNSSYEGKFFFDQGQTIKYMLLEPSECFKNVVDNARCVILAGGTMEPISDFTENLISYVPANKIVKFSCDHIIPDENLNTFLIKDNFEFTFDKRKEIKLVEDLFYFFYKLSFKVPFGVVGFFPSYSYLEFVIETWKKLNLFKKLNAVKAIYYESTGSKDVLAEYTDTIQTAKRGAILLSVVGGRLSEGINFQDDLARAVVMVGLPFPNIFSGELIIKRKHLEQKVIKKGGTKQDSLNAAREFYENICMKAVNQSIGRAIRHANDYANIYLVDKRYGTPNIQKKLSEWVRRRIEPGVSTEDVLTKTGIFFKGKQQAGITTPK